MEFRLVAAGDNSGRKLLQDGVAALPIFQDCQTRPFFDPSDVAHLSGDDILAVVLKSGDLYIAGSGLEKLPFLVSSVRVAGSTIYALGRDCVLRVVGQPQLPFNNERLVAFAISSRFVAAISASGDCRVAIHESPETVATDCVAVGCTSAAVFAATATGLVEYTPERRATLRAARIIAVECSEDDAYFIDDAAVLWRLFEGTLVRVEGLPPVVAVSAGIQHMAAIGADGKLFIWGFNPSGQLGIGSDRAVGGPVAVLDNALIAVCGSQNTWALLGPGPPLRPKLMRATGVRQKAAGASALPYSERLLI
jgi:hypothetical protein